MAYRRSIHAKQLPMHTHTYAAANHRLRYDSLVPPHSAPPHETLNAIRPWLSYTVHSHDKICCVFCRPTTIYSNIQSINM